MIYLSLGSNLGNREEFLTQARVLIELHAGKIIKTSSIFETEHWTNEATSYQPPATSYLNQVICIESQLSPLALLHKLMNIEKTLGRIRSELRTLNPEPRTIDIDILFYNDLVLNSETLIIPHSLLQQRKFVLIPLTEIASEFIHPVLNKTIKDLLKDCTDNSVVTVKK